MKIGKKRRKRVDENGRTWNVKININRNVEGQKKNLEKGKQVEK